MACPNCGDEVRLRKSLIRGKNDSPDSDQECPNCGAELSEKSEGSHRLEKGI